MDHKTNSWNLRFLTHFLVGLCFIENFSFGYVAKGSEFIEKPFTITRGHPNYQHEEIVDFRPFRWRLDPKSIPDFNGSSTMLNFKFWVGEDTPDRFPVFISVIHRQDNIQVQLPYTFHSSDGTRSRKTRYTLASRTICLEQFDTEKDSILVTVTSGTSQLIDFHMNVTVEDAEIRLDEYRKFNTTPMTPSFLKFPFNETLSENVVLRVTANNENCIAISTQEPKCPAFAVENNFRVGNNGWHMVAKQAAIRINMRERKYFNGFFIKMILLQDDTLCGKIFSNSGARRRTNVEIVIQNDLPATFENGQFLVNMLIPPVLSLMIGVVIGSCYLISYACSKRQMLACRTYNVNRAESKSVCVEQFVSRKNAQSNNYGRWTIYILLLYVVSILLQAIDNGLDPNAATGLYGKCSYNSKCSHDFWVFKDFNHLWSNISYLIMGSCFIFISLMKNYMKRKSEEGEGIQYFVGLYYAMGLGLISKGIMSFAYHLCPTKSNSQHDIIYLAILVAICQLSISGFRRPNTFSIDFSCGALIVILLMAALGNAFERYFSAHEEVFFGFRIFVTAIQGIFIFYAGIYAIYIGYPMNRSITNAAGQSRMFQRSNNSDSSNSKCRRVPTPSNEKFRRYSRFLWIFPKVWQWKLPKFSFERYFYVVLLFALNGYLIYYSLTANYCLYVFAFLGANFGLNLAYYLLMKIVFGEFACSWKSVQVLLYLIVALGVGAAAGYFFYENLEEWSDPSSHYRTGDEDCSWLKPYPYHDKHDSYHILSAYAFFFLFMVLLSIDDGVEGVNREYLLVF